MKFPRIRSAAVVFLVCVCAAFCACGAGGFEDNFKKYDCFSVNFIDVGEGDAIFINFNDGKTMLIDCGEKNSANLKAVERYIDAYSGDNIDYLVLTHPDYDHVGNAADIIENYGIGTAFIPDLIAPQNFIHYYAAYLKLAEKGVNTRVSATFEKLCGEEYTLVFLSPNAADTADSAYDAINAFDDPPPAARNAVSPIVYLSYKGVRFLFTGDAGFSQESVALANVKNGLIDRVLGSGRNVELGDIDFLKVSHHGASDASGAEFLSRITPKNAVISVGGDNIYGHPTTETLNGIYSANINCNVYLTSRVGTVSVLVNADGEVSVITDAKA